MKQGGIKDVALGRSDIYKLAPRDVYIKDGWNCRDFSAPENIEHVAMLALSIAEVGVKEPLTVIWDDGKAYVTDGECRLRAAWKALDDGAEIATIPVKTEERGSNEADRLFSQAVRNTGKVFTPMEKGKLYKRLLDLGWQIADIARKEGRNAQYVGQLVDLQGAPTEVREMVNKGEVSATLASTVLRKSKGDGGKATATLKDAKDKAAKAGKTRVTAKHVGGDKSPAVESKPAAFVPTMSLVVKLASAVVHFQELLSSDGHHLDQEAVDSILADQEVRAFLDAPEHAVLLPCRRVAEAA